jgi:hypothetical protein
VVLCPTCDLPQVDDGPKLSAHFIMP